MLKIFKDVAKTLKRKTKPINTDNIVFRLHYRLTFAALLSCVVLVSSQQYFGEHIRCLTDKGVEQKVINTFCFFMSTYSVVRHFNSPRNVAPYPGVGPHHIGEPTVVHAYYQWVPFLLFLQALLFYMPHYVWKHRDNGRVKMVVEGFENAALAFSEKRIKLKKGEVPSKKDVRRRIADIQCAFLSQLRVNRMWGISLVLCEFLNLLNVVLQVWLMDVFLGGRFYTIGDLFMGADPEDPVKPMDLLFPKVTKCTFRKYGPSGTIQTHDALCVMALNVVNEKIYVFLWFWFIGLFLITALNLVYRLLSMLLHCRCVAFNQMIYYWTLNTSMNSSSVATVMRCCCFSDWLLLNYIAQNMNCFVFRDLFDGLAAYIDGQNRRKADVQKQGREEEGLPFTCTETPSNSPRLYPVASDYERSASPSHSFHTMLHVLTDNYHT